VQKITESESSAFENQEEANNGKFTFRKFISWIWPKNPVSIELQSRHYKRSWMDRKRTNPEPELEQFKKRIQRIFRRVDGYESRVRIFRDGTDLSNIVMSKPWSCLE
jgi:hypothetical protein